MSKEHRYIVYGGEVITPETDEFKDPKAIQLVGLFDDYDEALTAWRGEAQRTVDNAHMRFFVAKVERNLKA